MTEVEELCLGTSSELTETSQSLFELKVCFSKSPNLDNISLYDGIHYYKGYYTFKNTSLEKTISKIIYCCESQDIVMKNTTADNGYWKFHFWITTFIYYEYDYTYICSVSL